jgi:pimeloyl-ACP methyl ester carboxylesterase
MKKRTGVIGTLIGVVGLTVATGAVVADRRVASRRRELAGRNPYRFDQLPVDRSGTVTAEDGTALHYEEVGPRTAPLTVVFVHGFSLRLGAFHFQREAIAAHYGDDVRLVFYDQRGHGKSGRSEPESANIDQLGRDLYSLLTNLAPDGPVVLVGHSMGGMTIMALADAHPELFERSRRSAPRIAGVGLLSTSTGKLAAVTFGLPALFAKLRGPLLPVLLRGARRQANLVERSRTAGTDIAWVIIRRMSFGSTDVDPLTVEYLTSIIAGTRIEVIADFYSALMNHDKLVALDRLCDLPVLIMCGDHDLLTPPEHSTAMADGLPNAEVAIVPNAGHAALLEHPDVFAAGLERLIDTALARAADADRQRRRRTA